MIDKRAKKILMDHHWKSGWIDRQNRQSDEASIAYARSKGFWFDPIEITHDALVGWIGEVRSRVTAREVGDAFLASLSTRRLDLRSALGSFGYLAHFPDHGCDPLDDFGRTRCRVCWYMEGAPGDKEDLNVLNFERHKWGGVRHGQPIYAWFDLSRFVESESVAPTDEDRRLLRGIIDIAEGLPDDARPAQLADALKDVVKSNANERKVLIQILSLAGVLQPEGLGGYFTEFTPTSERKQSALHYNDWTYPALWWRGSDRVNWAAVAVYFPDL